MPQTRRPTSTDGLVKRKLKRRRMRKSTWIDLLSDHNKNARTQRTSPPPPPVQSVTQSRAPSSPRTLFETAPSSTPQRGHAPVSPFGQHAPSSPGISDEHDSQYHIEDEMEPNDEINRSSHENTDARSWGAADIFENTENEAAARRFYQLLNEHSFMCSPSNIIALTMLCGSVKFSVKQYEIVRALVNHATEKLQLPSYSTVKRKLLPHLLHKCYPTSTTARFPLHGRFRVVNSDNGYVHQVVPYTRVVFPTEWARIDVASLPHYENIFSSPSGDNSSPSIEEAPITRHRDQIVDVTRYFLAEDKYGRTAAHIGDEIAFAVSSAPSQTAYQEMIRLQFQTFQSNESVIVRGTVESTWCVGSPNEATESGRDALRNASVISRSIIADRIRGSSGNHEGSAEPLRNRGRSGQKFFLRNLENIGTVLPGDMCCLLVPVHHPRQPNDNSRMCCILVSRCLKRYEGMASQFVIWFHVSDNENGKQLYSVLDVQDTIGSPKLHRENLASRTKRDPANVGLLADGRRYVIYRVMLYCDDFKESGSPYSQSSCGGVYLLPLGMTHKARRSRTAVHVVSLTPPGISTNEILMRIIPDIVKGSMGLQGSLPSGEPVIIFLDVVGFVADYPAAAEPLDVLGHTADTPCTHCTIRKFKENDGSCLGFTTALHALNPSTLRCAERHAALRKSDLSNRQTNILGMKRNDVAAKQEYPLSVLRRELMAVRPMIPLTNDGVPVLTGLFDPFRSSVIAPDHLLSGLARNIVDVCFRTLTPDTRIKVDIAICCSLMENGLPRQRTVYNEKKIQLHSMSLSSVFSVLLVFHPVCLTFPLPEDAVFHDTLRLLEQLKNLIAMTYWNPSVATDGEKACEMITKDDGKPYHSFLQALAERYVTEVDRFCSEHPELGAILDKPNLHRLLELFHISIPSFGHVSLIQELVFETAHQPMKRSVSSGNHRDAEASAVEHSLGNDWQARLGLLYERLHSEDEDERNAACNGLMNILFGSDAAVSLAAAATSENISSASIRRAIEICFSEPLLHVIRSNGNINSALGGSHSRWTTNCAGFPPREHDGEGIVERIKEFMGLARRKLHNHIANSGRREDDIGIKWKAKRTRQNSDGGQAPSSAQNALTCGTLFQAIIRRQDQSSSFVRPHGKGDHVMGIFVSLGFLDEGNDLSWVVCARCERQGKDVVITPNLQEAVTLQLLRLNEGIRRIGVYHMCRIGETCHIDHDAKVVRHNESTLTGGVFRTQTRNKGYPPRLA